MSNTYGFVKCKIASEPQLKSSKHKNEFQYHLHSKLLTTAADGTSQQWDSAINVGTSDADDLLNYKLIFDFSHSVVASLKAAKSQFNDLTGMSAFPALDFLRSDVLKGTGPWQPTGVMDGSTAVEPVASLIGLLRRAQAGDFDVYMFGRTYKTGGSGVHDIHMNQGSQAAFLNDGIHDNSDHNDVWQDGAVLVDLGVAEFAAYFTSFTKQLVPTTKLGNPVGDSHEMSQVDEGSIAGRQVAN